MNMKMKLFSIIVIGYLIIIFGCGFRDNWQRCISYEGEFSVEMPGKPIAQKIIIDTDFGQTYLNLFMLTDKDRFVYSVSFVDYSSELFQKKTVQAILDDARNGAVLNIHGTLQMELPISIKEYPGRELVIEAANGKATVYSKLFLIKQRLYQLSITAPREPFLFKNKKKRFLDSFDIVEKNP